MKKLKQLFICLSAFVFCLGLTLATATTAQAASKDVPKKVHLYTGTQGFFDITFDSVGSKITNLKSSSKNLKVKLTHQGQSNCTISYYGNKKGSYKITFTIKPKKGKSINKTVKVNVDRVTPIKKVTYAGKTVPMYSYPNPGRLYTTAASGKLSISMNKGYKIKKITMTTYKQSNENETSGPNFIEKTIKNNKKITLGNSYYDGDSSSYSTFLSSKCAEIAVEYTSEYGTGFEYILIYKL